MREVLDLYLRRLTKPLSCSSDLSPSQQSSSSEDLLPEMMESRMPPPAMPPSEAGDPEVSSRRVSPNTAGVEGSHMSPQGSPCPAFDGGHRTSPAPSDARSEELMILLGRASISEEHRALMGTVIGRISSVESGLHEAVRSLLTGFEVRLIMYFFVSCA
jgi:hypothetical protein